MRLCNCHLLSRLILGPVWIVGLLTVGTSYSLAATLPLPAAEQSLAAPFKLGLENISAELQVQLKPLRLALITNQTGVTQTNQRNIDFLLAQGFKLVRIYVPEHGLTGKVLAEKKVPDTIDATTKIPVVSLYGGDSAFKKPSKRALDELDAFVFDLQDSGMRHYTYISILFRMMQVAAEFQKRFIVLDRPNPLGLLMEGPLVDAGLESFISIAAIPLRHALTVGELAQYFNAKLLNGAKSALPSSVAATPSVPAGDNPTTVTVTANPQSVNLTVVPLANYTRERGLGDQLLQPLSPNLASLQSLYGYSFLGLLGELNPLDTAIKTPAAFQVIGLPTKQYTLSVAQWQALQALLAQQQIKTELYQYTNAAGNWPFQGLRLQIADINQVAGFQALLACAQFFREQLALSFKYGPSFDKAVGTKKFKQWVSGQLNLASWQAEIQRELQQFAAAVTPYLLYTPAPKVWGAS